MTIGYEGMTVAGFIDKLLNHEVERLIDVRQLPLSRKPGFSKKALGENLQSAGIKYGHMASLGCPQPVRQAYRADGEWEAYVDKYETYLDSQLMEVRRIYQLASEERCCLMCFENDSFRCHRSLIATRLKKLYGDNIQIEHL